MDPKRRNKPAFPFGATVPEVGSSVTVHKTSDGQIKFSGEAKFISTGITNLELTAVLMAANSPQSDPATVRTRANQLWDELEKYLP